MYDELIKRLREKAGAFDYDGRPDIACDYEQAADAIEELIAKLNHADDQIERLVEAAEERRWIPVTERLPSDFVSVQAHIVGADPLPTVREAYVIGGKWFFPALKEFLPVDMWKRFDDPPKDGTGGLSN